MRNDFSRIFVGTASWSDPQFVEFWYPKRLPATARLGWYAQYFNLVEINSTFYSVPAAGMAEKWCDATPDQFVFNVKLHQLFSRHSTAAKLLPPVLRKRFDFAADEKVTATAELERELMRTLTPALQVLQQRGKLGVLLLQLSPAFSPRRHQLSELDNVLALAGKYRVAVELRNRNWSGRSHLEESAHYLREKGAAFVNVDAPTEKHFTIMPSDLNLITTPELAYLRLHGRDAGAYLKGKTVASRFNYDYSDPEIEEVAQRSRELAEEAREVHVVFNNNSRDYAPHAALRLRKALGQLVATPPQALELFRV